MNIVLDDLSASDNYCDYFNLLAKLTEISVDKITKEQFLQRLNLIKSNPLHKIIVAKHEGKIVGTITILIEPKYIRDLSYVAHVEDVAVDPLFRNLGIGKILLTKALNMAKEYDCYKIILDCSAECVTYYNKYGYEIKGVQMAQYLAK